MAAEISVEEAVLDLVRARSPRARERADLPGDLPLGSGGLGLDSIAQVELLLECEQLFGAPVAAELLAGPTLTVDGLVNHLRAVLGR
jgi:acyl carrier protein